MKELRTVLTKEKNVKEIRSVAEDAKTPEELAKMVQTITPLLNRMTKSLIQKYKITGGFGGAIAAIVEASKKENDVKLREDIDNLMEHVGLKPRDIKVPEPLSK